MKNYLDELPKVLGVRVDLVRLVVASMGKNIAMHRDQEEMNVILLNEVQRIALMYGATKEPSEKVLEESIELIRSRYSMLSLEELAEAFRMAVSGELDGCNTKVYNGVFTINNLGSVLGVYRKLRRRVVGAWIKWESEMKGKQELERLTVDKKTAYDSNFPEMMASKKGTIRHWSEVKMFWYSSARRLGLLHFDLGEADGIFKEAVELAKKEAVRLKREYDVDDAKAIARKITVFRKLLK